VIRQALSVALKTVKLRRDPVQYFRSQGVEIGEGVEIFGASIFTFGSEPYLVSIGNYVTISHDVDFITHDGGLRVARDQYPNAYLYGRIHVGDHCFLGAHCVLLPGVRVGMGSVIGSGSIVARDIPSGVVAVGVPAKPIKTVDEYVEEKRHLWVDTGGLAPDVKREVLRRSLRENS
jgi:acetyltransferase-like isoleucine patch superfamily enzyme